MLSARNAKSLNSDWQALKSLAALLVY